MAASSHVQERLPDEFTDEQQKAGCKDPLKQIDIVYSQHGEMQREKKKKKVQTMTQPDKQSFATAF